MFTPIWGRFPFWLIFFQWVGSTTNYYPENNIEIMKSPPHLKKWKKPINNQPTGILIGFFHGEKWTVSVPLPEVQINPSTSEDVKLGQRGPLPNGRTSWFVNGGDPQPVISPGMILQVGTLPGRVCPFFARQKSRKLHMLIQSPQRIWIKLEVPSLRKWWLWMKQMLVLSKRIFSNSLWTPPKLDLKTPLIPRDHLGKEEAIVVFQSSIFSEGLLTCQHLRTTNNQLHPRKPGRNLQRIRSVDTPHPEFLLDVDLLFLRSEKCERLERSGKIGAKKGGRKTKGVS